MDTITTIYLLFGLLCILQVLDVYSTVMVIKNGGYEANPILKFLMNQFGVVPALVTVKVIFIFAVYLFLDYEYIKELLIAINFVYALVVINNFKVLKRLTKQ